MNQLPTDQQLKVQVTLLCNQSRTEQHLSLQIDTRSTLQQAETAAEWPHEMTGNFPKDPFPDMQNKRVYRFHFIYIQVNYDLKMYCFTKNVDIFGNFGDVPIVQNII